MKVGEDNRLNFNIETMANGNIWGSSQAPNFMDQVVNAMTWDKQMTMKRESQMMSIIKEADPVKFMSYANQNEQVARLEEIEKVAIDLSIDKSGKFTTKDMMDMNFMLNDFEAWQDEQQGKLDMFSKEYSAGLTRLDKISMPDFLAGVETYMKDPDSWQPGKMLKAKSINPLNRAFSVKPPTGGDPLRQVPRMFNQDGVTYQETTSVWATPEQKEAAFMQDYIGLEGFKEGVSDMWDDVGLEDQALWLGKMEEYNTTRKPNEPPIDNVQAYFGLKMIAPNYMRNTSEIKSSQYMQPKKKDPSKEIRLVPVSGGTPQGLSRQVMIDDTLVDVDYGESEAFVVDNFKTGKDLVFDEYTFVSKSDDDIDWFGKPASKAIVKDKQGNSTGENLMGRSGKVQEIFVRKNMPVYVGADTTMEKSYPYTRKEEKGYFMGMGSRTIEKSRKGDMSLYKNQPLSQSHLNGVKASFDNDTDFNEWVDDNVQNMPVAIMPVSGGFEVMRVFDKPLADFMEVSNPEFVLGKKLKTEKDEEEEEVIPDVTKNPFDQFKR